MTSTEYNPNCPECKGSLIYDYNKGEIVCQNCGQVLELIDHYGPESNTFDNNCNKINETENDELNAKLAYQDIGGLNEVLQKVKEIIELPLTEPQLLKKLGIEPPKGILLFGPPGTGKTLLAKAIPNETSTGFYSIDAPTLITKGNYGEPEEKLREIFQQAKENAPSIIFIDEVDSIAANREITATNHPIHRVVSQLLTLMDGMSSRGQVIVIGSTNRPDAIDPAFRRTGRFDREIEIKAPDSKGRLDILRIHTRKMQLAQDVSLEKIADMCYGFVGADLQGLANEAGMHAVARQKLSVDKDNYVNMNVNNNINYSSKRKNIKIDDMIITMEDFMNAVKTIKPSAMRQITTVQTSDVR
jgi:transitional endoplasmic reticulum ATPase